MKPLAILLVLVAVVFIFFIVLQLRKIFLGVRRMSSANTAKNIQIIQYDDSLKNNNLKLRDWGPVYHWDSSANVKSSGEKRTYPRRQYRTIVEFIKKGRLFKETSEDLSYSGIFLKSQRLQSYDIGDKIFMTFQPPMGRFEKRQGRIVRKTKKGLGIRFLEE